MLQTGQYNGQILKLIVSVVIVLSARLSTAVVWFIVSALGLVYSCKPLMYQLN